MSRGKQKFILANLSNAVIAVPLTANSDFFQIKNITFWPDADAGIVGLTYHQGHIVVVLEATKLLKMHASLDSGYCLQLDWEGEHFGLVVDAVGEVISADIITDKKTGTKFILHKKDKIRVLEIDQILKA